MAHVGKAWERLFPRDLSPYTDFIPPNQFYPVKYGMEVGASGGLLTGWTHGRRFSGDGTWDYTPGRIKWAWTAPPGADPTTTLEFWVELSHLPTFVKGTWYAFKSGSQIAYSDPISGGGATPGHPFDNYVYDHPAGATFLTVGFILPKPW